MPSGTSRFFLWLELPESRRHGGSLTGTRTGARLAASEANGMSRDETFIHFWFPAMLTFSVQIHSSVRRSFAIPVEIIVITIS